MDGHFAYHREYSRPIALFFVAMAVRSFWQRRLQFAMVLESHSTGMSKDRYIRLLLLPCGMLLYMLPLTMSSFIQSFVLYPMLPWSECTIRQQANDRI